MRVVDLSPAEGAGTLRFAVVPAGRAVLVSVDLLDGQSAARLFPGARSFAGIDRLVVYQEPERDLVRFHRPRGYLLFSAQAHEPAALQQPSGDAGVLDPGAVRRLGRDSSRRATARVDTEPEHGLHGADSHSASRHRD